VQRVQRHGPGTTRPAWSWVKSLIAIRWPAIAARLTTCRPSASSLAGSTLDDQPRAAACVSSACVPSPAEVERWIA